MRLSLLFIAFLLLVPLIAGPLDAADLSGEETYPKDVTPDWLNFFPGKIQVHGNYVFIAGSRSDVHVFDVSDPNNPFWLKKIKMDETATDLHISNGELFVTGEGITIFDIDPIDDAHIKNFIKTKDWKSSLVFDNEFAYAHGWNYISIIDMSIPDDPKVVKEIETGGCGGAFNVSNGYAYYKNYQLTVLDIDPPEFSRKVTTAEIPGSLYGLEIVDGYAFLATGKLEILDIDPVEEIKILKTIDFEDCRRLVISDKYIYAIDQNTGLNIIDINSLGNARIIKTVKIAGEPRSICVSGDYAYICNYDCGIQVVDIKNPDTASITGSTNIPFVNSIKHVEDGYVYATGRGPDLVILDVLPLDSAEMISNIKMSETIQDICFSGGIAFIATKSSDAVQLWDISAPYEPKLIKEISCSSSVINIHASDKCLIARTSRSGFKIIDISIPEKAEIVASVENAIKSYGYNLSIAVENNLAFITSNENGLHIIDLSTLENATTLGVYNFSGVPFSTQGGEISHVNSANGYLLVVENVRGEDENSFLHVIDYQPVDEIHVFKSLSFPGWISNFQVDGDNAYLFQGSDILVLDISKPGEINVIDSIEWGAG